MLDILVFPSLLFFLVCMYQMKEGIFLGPRDIVHMIIWWYAKVR